MQSIIKKIVWVSLALIPFLALYVADGGTFDFLNWGTSGLYFPFISGKNLVFRVLVEIAFAGWALLALRDVSYRPNLKKSPLTIAYAIFMVVLLLADIFGVDRERSMWSNYERMEGFVGHIHFFAYFFVLTAMLPTLKDWQKMFKVFFASNLLVLIYGYGQMFGAKGYIFAQKLPELGAWFSARFPIHQSENRLDATIGNSAYFAIYCLMFAFIAALLWSQTPNAKRAWGYPVLIALNLIALFYSGTRGTMIGLVAGVMVTIGLIAWREKGHARKVFAGVLVAVVILVGSLVTFKNSSFVQSTPTLARLASISPTELTSMSRLSIWTISYEAFLERPILGYGQDNFSYIYARKFMPEKMWNLEPWYDRSHDVFFDWLVAAGILGLLSYLSLYVVALSLMWRSKKHDMPTREKAILTGALVGYFVHNIFVFDNLTSYILFFALLAYIVMRTKGGQVAHHSKGIVTEEQMNYIWMPIVGVVLLVTLYFVNYRPYLVNTLLIQGMSVGQLVQKMPFADAIKIQQEAFTSAIALHTLGSEESREQFLQMGVRLSQVNIPAETPAADKQAGTQAINNFIKAVRDDVTASLSAHKEDVRMLTIYGMFYNGIGDAISGEQVIGMAHVIAPKKQLISFDLIRSYLMQRKYTEAYALAREVYDLQPIYPDAQKWYVLTAVYAGSFKDARAHIKESGLTVPFDGDILNAVVTTGQIPLALELLAEVKRTNPEYSAQVDAYIKQLLAPGKK
ncbi:MAG: O-antigen ligase family protein [Candidatus Paceibacterota bacterium]